MMSEEKNMKENTQEQQQPAPVGPFYYVSIDPDTNIVRNRYQLFTQATADNFRAISQADYEALAGWPGAKIDADGTLEKYTPPLSPESLQTQARAAMQQVQQQAAMATAMGEEFGPEMQAYVRSLREILNGKSAASTALPTAPEDPTS